MNSYRLSNAGLHDWPTGDGILLLRVFTFPFFFSAAVKAAGCYFCCRVPVSRTTGKLHAPVRNSSLILSPGDRPGGVIIFALATGHCFVVARGYLRASGHCRPCRAAAAAAPNPDAAAGQVRGWAVGRWGPASSRAGHAASGRGRAARRRLAPHGRPSIIYPCARGPGCAQRACQGPAVGTQR